MRVSLSLTANDLPPCSLLALGLLLLGCGACGPILPRLAGERRELALSELLHHLRHLLAGLEQTVDLLDARAAALRDPLPPRAVDHVREAPLLRGHREHDRLDSRELAIVDLVEPLELAAEARDQLQHSLD